MSVLLGNNIPQQKTQTDISLTNCATHLCKRTNAQCVPQVFPNTSIAITLIITQVIV